MKTNYNTTNVIEFRDINMIADTVANCDFVILRENEKRPLKIGISGAHRTGKSVLATTLSQSEFAKKYNIRLFETNVQNYSIWNLTCRSSDYYTFAERIEIQTEILTILEDSLNKYRDVNFISDRTPLDILAYLLANIDHTTSKFFDTKTNILISNVIELIKNHFTHIFIILPGINPLLDTEKVGKTYNSLAYQEAITNQVIGIFYRYLRNFNIKMEIIPKHLLNISDRVDYITKFFQ